MKDQAGAEENARKVGVTALNLTEETLCTFASSAAAWNSCFPLKEIKKLVSKHFEQAKR